MPTKSNTDLIVLALVAEEPIHGYDLVKKADEGKVADWADLPSSSVYQSLKNLEAKGYIKAKEVRVGKSPPRAVYRITAGGRSALIGGLLRLMTDPLDPRDDFSVALLGAETIPKDRALEALDIHTSQVMAKFGELEEYFEENREEMSFAYRAIYSRLIEQYRAHIEWLENFVKQVKDL